MDEALALVFLVSVPVLSERSLIRSLEPCDGSWKAVDVIEEARRAPSPSYDQFERIDAANHYIVLLV